MADAQEDSPFTFNLAALTADEADHAAASSPNAPGGDRAAFWQDKPGCAAAARSGQGKLAESPKSEWNKVASFEQPHGSPKEPLASIFGGGVFLSAAERQPLARSGSPSSAPFVVTSPHVTPSRPPAPAQEEAASKRFTPSFPQADSPPPTPPTAAQDVSARTSKERTKSQCSTASGGSGDYARGSFASAPAPASRATTAAPSAVTSSPAGSQAGDVQVYAPGFKYVLNLPSSCICHLPPASLNVTRLVLCANYDPKEPETSCAMGPRCKFVHADTTNAKEHAIHVNYAWRALDEVTYERFGAGQTLHVAPPNSKAATDVMDSGLMLKTKALASNRRPLSHCAHYYFNRTCNLGADCRFVHAVFIDPSAKEHQRAPIPSMRTAGVGYGADPSNALAAGGVKARGANDGPPSREGSTAPLSVTAPSATDSPASSGLAGPPPAQCGSQLRPTAGAASARGNNAAALPWVPTGVLRPAHMNDEAQHGDDAPGSRGGTGLGPMSMSTTMEHLAALQQQQLQLQIQQQQIMQAVLSMNGSGGGSTMYGMVPPQQLGGMLYPGAGGGSGGGGYGFNPYAMPWAGVDPQQQLAVLQQQQQQLAAATAALAETTTAAAGKAKATPSAPRGPGAGATAAAAHNSVE